MEAYPTTCVVAVFFVYDALLTIDREIACFWIGGKWNAASLLFFTNKGMSLVYYATVWAELSSFPSDQVSRSMA